MPKNTPTNHFSSYRLEMIVFISGMVGMILELLGTRVMAPYFGSSLFTWTAIISVVLGSLSVGYYFGGKIADRQGSFTHLSNILLYAAACVCFIVLSNKWVMQTLDSLFPLKISVTLVSIILFGPSSVLLGMISPLAVKLKLTALASSGANVGRLYAISTAGSITGTMLAGFFLITYFGTTNLLIMMAGILILNSWLAYPRIRPALLLNILLMLAVMYVSQANQRTQINRGMIEVDTPYSHAYVMDIVDKERPMRVYFTGLDETQSAIYLDKPKEAAFNYIRFFQNLSSSLPQVKKAMLIGGGTYTLPQLLTDSMPELNLDIAEIDPKLLPLSQKYFFYKPSDKTNIFHQDGRRALRVSPSSYDLIFLDAFSNYVSIPPHLTTVEFMSEIKSKLSESGVLAINVIGSLTGEKGRFIQSFYQTISMVFPDVQIYSVDESQDPTTSQNWVIVASRDQTVLGNLNQINDFETLRYKQAYSPTGPIFTDDFNPVDQYTLSLL